MKFQVRSLYFMVFLISVCYILCFSSVAKAQSHSTYDKDNLDLVEDILEKAARLSNEVLKAGENSIVDPYIKIGREFIVLDSGFWQLVKGWIRLYRSELEVYCPCNINEDELVKEAKDYVAKNFIHSKIGKPIVHFTEHGSMTFYGYAAKYGKIAALLKASAEVAEHSLSIFFVGKGIHIFCNVIDVLILFLFRKAQIYTRVFSNSKTMNKNRLLMVFRIAWLNRLMKKAQKKVFFYMESTDIDQTALMNVNREGAGKNKRAKWVRSISEKTSPILKQINELDAQLTHKRISDEEKIKLLRKRAKLVKKMKSFTQVSRNSFFGKKYKRFLFLWSRKGKKNYLKGTTITDQMTSGDWFWALSIQENILERALMRQAEKENIFQKVDRVEPLKEDDIRTGLANEFVEKMKNSIDQNMIETKYVQFVERILMDIDNIFDPSLSVKKRYLLVSVIEAGLTGFFEHYLNLIHNKLSASNEDLNISGKLQLRWKLNRFVYYVYVYADFLRTVSLIKDKIKINSYKYEAMENYLLFFEYLNELSQISHSKNTKQELLFHLEQGLHRIKSFQVHLEKRTAFSWIPFHIPLPYCRNLVRF